MRTAKLLFILLLDLSIYGNAQSLVQTDNYSNDSLSFEAKKLRQLYLLATTSNDGASNIYTTQFFDRFPNTFMQLNELYGDHPGTDHKPAPLNDEAEQQIAGLFNNLKNISDTLYYKKIVSIAIGGHWDADAINFFQHGLIDKVLNNPALIVHILDGLPGNKVQSFWYFFFDGPIVDKQIAEILQKIKVINSRIYDLMIKAHDNALKRNQ